MSSVFRVLDTFLITSTDPERDLLAVHFQGDDLMFCGGADFLDAGDARRVLNQEDIVREVNRLVDAPIFIYRLSDVPSARGQARREFFAEDWLYCGTHTVVSRSGDLFADGPGAKSLGYGATGTVFDHAGNPHDYEESQNLLVAPDGVFGFINEEIWVRRTGES